MQANAKFAVAIHSVVMVWIADEYTPDRPITSDELGRHAATNPVFVRRVFGKLREAGLLRSQSGPGGGWHLAKPAEEITMAAIYSAVQSEPLFTIPGVRPEADYRGPRIPPVLAECLHGAEKALMDRLAETTLAEVIASACAAGIDPALKLAEVRGITVSYEGSPELASAT